MLSAGSIAIIAKHVIRSIIKEEDWGVCIKKIMWHYFYFCGAIFVFRYLPQWFDIIGDTITNLLERCRSKSKG